MQNNLNLQPPHFPLLPKTDIAAASPKDPTNSTQTSQGKTISIQSSDIPFDICLMKTPALRLKPALLMQNREIRKANHSMGGQAAKLLRPGMVLLKNYVSCRDQVHLYLCLS